MLLTDLNKNSEAKNVKSVESSKAIIVNSKRTFSSPAKVCINNIYSIFIKK